MSASAAAGAGKRNIEASAFAVERYHTVKPIWPGETVACIGCGPSLRQSDVDYLRGRCRVIAINLAIRMAPWADALYACDEDWWDSCKDDWQQTGAVKYTISELAGRRYGLNVLENAGGHGFDDRPWALRHGKNSGYQAVHLAVHLGAKRIILLGYDMTGHKGRLHWHADYGFNEPSPEVFVSWRERFAVLAAKLAERDIEVVNCSRSTALTCFPRAGLADVL